ncbi:MAG: alpha-amylase [Alloprevotella sp.]|nr:alpha-amylase [Alloprevotella sp.]
MSQNERITIYQVLPRLYGNTQTANRLNGTLEENGVGKMADFTDARLRRIHDFGFTHIWYTGLLEHATQTDYSRLGIRRDHPAVVKGRAGSPYAVKDYYDVDPDLALEPERRMEEFESLVARTHKAGLRMLMDFIPNHVARQYFSDARPDGVRDLGQDDNPRDAFNRDNNFYYIPGETLHLDNISAARAPEAQQHGAPYTESPARVTGNDHFDAWPSDNDWYETVKLNYGVDYQNSRTRWFPLTPGDQTWENVPSTWRKMTEILLFWASKGVDGFRCDMAEMVPVEFWGFAIPRVKEQYPGIVFIAEVYNPSEYRNYLHRGRFDYLYDKVGLYDTLRAVVRGETAASAITSCWQAVDDIRPHMLNFLENHDEQRIASPFFAGDPRRALPALVVSAALGTSPFMLYAGQELGERAEGASGFSGDDGRTTIFDYWSVPSYRKLLRGKAAFTADERALYDYYQRIVSLQNASAALREGSFFDLMYVNPGGEGLLNPQRHYAFLRHAGRETLLVVANFSADAERVSVRIPAHAFDVLGLKEKTATTRELLTGKRLRQTLLRDGFVQVELPAYGAAILSI